MPDLPATHPATAAASPMKLLLSYLRGYWPLVVLALVLAAINQIFSLLDPLIFRHVIDEYATRFQEYTTGEFFRGVSVLLLAAVGVAFVSRVAKNFQDYFVNVITQRMGAAALCGRRAPLAGAALSGVRGSTERRDAGQAAEGPIGCGTPDFRVDQHRVHLARRHHLRHDLRVHGSLDHRARLFHDGAAARVA